jgi:hypothetical protein
MHAVHQKIRGKVMSTERVIVDLERTIRKVCKDIKKRNGSVGGDKLDSLSKLVNSYSRLLERTSELKDEEQSYRDEYMDAVMNAAE